MIYAIYVRVSTDEQNIDQQIDMIKQYAKRNSIKIRTYKDYNVSGKIAISNRPAGIKLYKDINKNKIQGIIVTKWDRITRVLKHSLDFLDFIKAHELKLISMYDGEFKGTPDDIFTFKLKCLLSEYEMLQLDWRRAIGIARAKKEGKYKGRKKGALGKKNIN